MPNGKLEDTAVKCRFLGMGDADGYEQYKGYALLDENSMKIFYAKSVRFPKEVTMQRLPQNFLYDDTEEGEDFGHDPDFIPDAAESDEDYQLQFPAVDIDATSNGTIATEDDSEADRPESPDPLLATAVQKHASAVGLSHQAMAAMMDTCLHTMTGDVPTSLQE